MDVEYVFYIRGRFSLMVIMFSIVKKGRRSI